MTEYTLGPYAGFRCLAAACPDSCCALWDVVLDDETATRYRTTDGALGEAFRAHMQVDADGDTIFAPQNGRCPFWQADGLCRIQCTLGESALCETCRRFPRLRHEYTDFAECCLSLACPHAAHLTLEADALPVSVPQTQDETLHALALWRRDWTDTVTDRSIPFGDAVCRILRQAASLQGAAVQTQPSDAADLFAALGRLDCMTDAFRTLTKKPQRTPHITRHTAENLCVYYLFNYVLQAVADGNVLFAMQMMCTALTFVSFAAADAQTAARLFCKEAEHSYENMEQLRVWFETHPAFSVQTFLRIWTP